MRIQGIKASAVASGLAVLLVTGCTEDRSPARERREEPGAPPGPAVSPSAPAQPADEPLPDVSGSLDGTGAARVVLRRPDVRPEHGFVSEGGDLLVTWRVERRGALCRTPEVVTWVSYDDWRHGVDQARVRAWLVDRGQRSISPAGPGFLLEPSACRADDPHQLDRPLVIDGRGGIRRARPTPGPPPPRQGMLSTACRTVVAGSLRAFRRELCQLDPESGRMWRLPEPLFWTGVWDDATSIIWRLSGHISGTWSDDGGTTWHETWDPWDATVARWAGETYLFTNSMAGHCCRATRVHRLPDGVDLRFLPTGFGPPDAIDTGVVLARSTDGYRRWHLTEKGVLVGTTRRPVVYVSRARDWSTTTRHEIGRGLTDVVGRFLVSQSSVRSATLGPRKVLRLSGDYGRSWSNVDLSDVRPR